MTEETAEMIRAAINRELANNNTPWFREYQQLHYEYDELKHQ